MFRLLSDAIFSLERNERRKIPLQLQRLFGRLLLLDRQSASTTDLTNSFGWTNNEVRASVCHFRPFILGAQVED